MEEPSSNSISNELRKFIALRVNGLEFCVDINNVREIRGWTATTPLPRAPSYVRGVINLRGKVLLIIDLAARLGLAPMEPTSTSVITVIDTNEQPVGLLVEAVSDILAVADSDIQPTPNVGSVAAGQFVRGVLNYEGRMISLIAIDEVLGTADAPRTAAA
jgi:purine-binding chemotaxis protein CheW